MPITTYQTGTATVAADGTTVTGVGAIWTGGNARAGDEFVIGASRALITDVVDATHLTITPWPGASQSGAAYTIYQTSSRRFDDVAIADDLRKQVSALNNAGYFHFVPAGATAPDPSLGDENQLAFQANTGKFWQKQSGVWVAVGSPYGLQPAQNLADLTDPSAARGNLGATSVGNALFTAANASAALDNLGGTTVGKALFTAANASAAASQIIEYGSNANGRYLRFANGYQICTGDAAAADTGFVAVTLPASFANNSYALVAGSTSSSSTVMMATKTPGKTASGFQVGVIIQIGTNYANATVGYIAGGSWF